MTTPEPALATMLALLTRLHRATRALDAFTGMHAPISEVAALTDTINEIADELTRLHSVSTGHLGAEPAEQSA